MDFAIVGLDCLLPDADGADAWIENSRVGTPAFRDVPEGRWPFPAAEALDAHVGAPDRVPTLRGAFVQPHPLTVDRTNLDGWPIDELDPLFRWVLRVTQGATRGVELRPERTDLLLANLSLPSTGSVRAMAAPYLEHFRAMGVEVPSLAGGQPWDRYHSDLPAFLAAKSLGIAGHVTSVDAACASALYAVRLACDRLAAGLCDTAVAAAVNRSDSAFLFFGFAQLRALSPTGQSRPFDRHADGLLIGEGAAAVTLKRLSDAVYAGDTIHAVIRGAGLGNDGRKGNLLAPSGKGQLRTLESAWKRANLLPNSVGYIECHATGTPVGDRIEVETLRTLLAHAGGVKRPVALSSAKALIGHTVTAAGLAGLIRAVGAVRNGFLPPTPCADPVDAIDGHTLRVVQQAETWDEPARRAAVSAFGFGGTNAHLILDRYRAEDPLRPATAAEPTPRMAVVSWSATVGNHHAPADLATALLDGASTLAPAPASVSRGLPAVEGTYVPAVGLDPAAYRIPPLELAELLPQQALFLKVAAEALALAGPLDTERTGSIVGMGLDHQIGESVLRWHLAASGPAGDRLKDTVSPPLTASRVQGSLPNFIANRIAALADLQGPSYTTSADTLSLAVAMDHAGRLLASGEADAVLVGAVDLPGQVGAAAADLALNPAFRPAEAAAAFVVRRLEDAERDGQRIHAVIEPTNHEGEPLDADVHHANVGHARAADGAVALVSTLLGLETRTHPVKRLPWLVDGGPIQAHLQFRHPSGLTRSMYLTSAAACARQRGPAVIAWGASTPAALAEQLVATTHHLETLVAQFGEDAHRALVHNQPVAAGLYRVAVVAESVRALRERIADAHKALVDGGSVADPRGLYVGTALEGRTAFVYPGAGGGWRSMGLGIWRAFPHVHDRLAARTERLRTQTIADRVYAPADGDLALGGSTVEQIWASAWYAILLTDVFRHEFGLQPTDALGYSLGEASALVSLGAWTDADQLEERITTWSLYTSDLAGPMDAVRHWLDAHQIPWDGSTPWSNWLVKTDRAHATAALQPGCALVLVNTADEVVIGGPSPAIETTLAALAGERLRSPFPACVHAPPVLDVAEAYTNLHRVPTVPVSGVQFWSAATFGTYVPSEERAAAAIVGQAQVTIDYPRLINAAWDAGIRTFIELGPRGACTRWIGENLSGRAHLAVQTDRVGQTGLGTLAHAVARLSAAGHTLDTRSLAGHPVPLRPEETLVVPHSGPVLGEPPSIAHAAHQIPVPLPLGETAVEAWVLEGKADPAMAPLAWGPYTPEQRQISAAPATSTLQPTYSGPTTFVAPVAVTQAVTPRPANPTTAALADGLQPLLQAVARSSAATADAHEVFLENQRQATDQIERVAAMVGQALDLVLRGVAVPRAAQTQGAAASVADPIVFSTAATQTQRQTPPPATPVLTATPRQFDHAALERFAAGKLSDCLGPAYADLDIYEPRTRLPMDPLLLVSRVIDVEGERGNLGPSRIITEYDIPVDAWWSHDGKAPPCVIIESGQADLFLVSYLGIDAICRGKRIYRLLDCDLEFHGPRPKLGHTLRHDIRIKRFAHLGEMTLFYFEYDAIDTGTGERVLTMRNGCAGFFTAAELEKPQGVKHPEPGPTTPALPPVVGGAPTRLDSASVDKLAAGDYSAAFGPAFAEADASGLSLPRAPWRLVHRVPQLTLSGGTFGLGHIQVEQDLHDNDWFNPCHFKDDPCMPGTLMFDGCVQALSLWLMAMGYPTQFRHATFEPIAGRATRLRCRGQVVPGHHRLTYDVHVKEAGVEPTPWVVADVILSVDGTPVVRAEDVNVRIHGERHVATGPQPTTVSASRVMEYSVGAPSRAFGPAYLPYDQGARVARMPGPPILTMTRVADIEGAAGAVEAHRRVVIDYDVPPDAWYFNASPGTSMPFVALLETSLQPCGWLTAWQQTAIQTGGDLYFRNLDGKATMYAQVWPTTGTLTTTAVQTSVAKAGGMVIHGFTMSVSAGDQLVFEGETRFGYFTAQALANQKGLGFAPEEEARRADLRARATVGALDLRDHEPVNGVWPRSDLRMVDRIVGCVPDGGRAGLGFWVGEKAVVTSEWFYTAHFHLDPVTPGSLGIEALCQLARHALAERVGPIVALEPVATGCEISWKYRGQIPPTRKMSTYELEVTGFEDGPEPVLIGDGVVRGDGMAIYEVKNLRVRARRALPVAPTPAIPPLRQSAAALLDSFGVDGLRGRGQLHLTGSDHPWLAAHCPTVVVPAVPMAFAAEIAAEAASLLCPGLRVVGLPLVEAEKWLHTGDGPLDVLVDAVRSGNSVAVTLSVFKPNPRFPKLSGPVVHMRADVTMGDTWAPAEAAPKITVSPSVTPDVYYNGGFTFHGPVLQAMSALFLGDRDAQGTFQTRPDADLLPAGSPAFILDPLLLDTATHPMMSGEPERWIKGLAPGHLAYPVRCDNLRLFGPRPSGEVDCRMTQVEGPDGTLVFDVWMGAADQPWCAFRWTEAIVDGGPLLGRPPAIRRPFCWENQPDAQVTVGHAAPHGWRVDHKDIVEPLPGTLIRLMSAPNELADWRAAPDLAIAATARIAAKEAARAWLRERLGRDVHPSTLHVLAMRADRYVIRDATSLTAQEYIDHLGPTRFDLNIAADAEGATAWFTPVQGR